MTLPLRPRERRTLENLLEAVGPGLDPSFGLSILSSVEQGALDRLARQREKRLGFAQMMPDVADFAANAASAGLPPSFTESAYSGFRAPVFQGGLDRLLGTLYPGGSAVSPYAAGPEPSDLMNAPAALTDPLSAFDMASFVTNIRQAVTQGVPPDEVRRVILASPNAAEYLKFQPYLDQVIDQLYANAVPQSPSPVPQSPAPVPRVTDPGRPGVQSTSTQASGTGIWSDNFFTHALDQLGLR